MKKAILFFFMFSFAGGISFRADFAHGAPVEKKSTRELIERLTMSPRWEVLGRSIYTVSEHPSRSFTMYVGTKRGLLVSNDEGQTWTELTINNASKAVFAVAVSPAEDTILLAGTREGLWKTENGGKEWIRVKDGLSVGHVPLSIVFCARSPHDAYMGTARHGVFRSFDGGNSWVPASSGLPDALGGGRIAPIKSLLVDPESADIAYVGTELSRIYKTTDGGETWQEINVGLPRLIMRRTFPPRLTVSPDDSSIIYVAIGIPIHSHLVQTSLYRSMDGGQSWQIMATGLPPNITVLSLRVDPTDSRIIYVRSRQGDFKVFSEPPFVRK